MKPRIRQRTTHLICLLFVFSWLTLLPLNAQAGIEFNWALQGGLRFDYLKNGLDINFTPPAFHEDRIGGSILFGLLGWLQINKYVELNATFDIGELFLGRRTAPLPENPNTRSSRFVLLLNERQLNLSAKEQQDTLTAIQQCKQQAATQGLPLSDCNDYHPLLQEGGFLRELYVTFFFDPKQWIKLDIGILSLTHGRALLFDNYGIGFHFDANWSEREGTQRLPLQLQLDLFLPDSSWTPEGKKSPTLYLAASYIHRKDQILRIFFSYLLDNDNLAGKLLLPLWKELFALKINDGIKSRAGDATSFYCDQPPSQKDQDILKSIFRPAQADANAAKLLKAFDEVCSARPSSRGHHFWVGLQGNWKHKKLQVEGAAILYFSQFTIGIPKLPSISPIGRQTHPLHAQSTLSSHQNKPEVNISQFIQDQPLTGLGLSGDIQLTYHWTPSFRTALFFLLATGEQLNNLNKKTIHTFMGLSPQVRYTNIFFNGGINAYSSKRGIGISGISGKGYIAPGLIAQYTIAEKLEAKLTATGLWAMFPSSFHTNNAKPGRFYGTELNLTGGYQLWKWLKPVAQIDLFFPGDFFASSAPPPLLFRVIIGLDFSYQS